MEVKDNPPVEETKKKKRKQAQSEEGGDDVLGCVFDGCFFWSWYPSDFDGCFHINIGGCFGGGDGCLPDFDGGCFDFGDGCSMVFFLPFRLLVILGLMLYGDWDFKAWGVKKL